MFNSNNGDKYSFVVVIKFECVLVTNEHLDNKSYIGDLHCHHFREGILIDISI